MTGKIDIYDDDINSISEYIKISNIVAEHNKDHLAKLIKDNGESLYSEIERRNKLRELEKDKYIKKILKSHKDKYSLEELKAYSLKDIRDIYDIITEEKKSIIKNIFKFFNK